MEIDYRMADERFFADEAAASQAYFVYSKKLAARSCGKRSGRRR